MSKYAKRKDANHSQIAKDLAKVGVPVLDTSGVGEGVPDLITNFRNLMCLIEIKFGEKAEFKRSQLEMMARWNGYAGFARNFEEAERLAKKPDVWALKGEQKRLIQQFLITWQGKKLHLPTFLKVIEGEKV